VGQSPDGRTIVFASSAGPVIGFVAIRSDGTHLRALVKPHRDNRDVFAQPTWSRDGKRLALVHIDVIPRTATIAVATSSGLRSHALATLPVALPPPGDWGGPAWSPNGSELVFSGPCGPQHG
jgi:Tol biopolymer transport system component